MFDEARGDRTRLDQRHMDAGAGKLHAQRVGESLNGKFRGRVGATIGCGDQPEHRGAEYDPAFAVSAHRWNDAPGEIMPAEDIGLELGAEHLRSDILERAGLAVPAIVEQRIELAVG
jgi:hypothetical protein